MNESNKQTGATGPEIFDPGIDVVYDANGSEIRVGVPIVARPRHAIFYRESGEKVEKMYRGAVTNIGEHAKLGIVVQYREFDTTAFRVALLDDVVARSRRIDRLLSKRARVAAGKATGILDVQQPCLCGCGGMSKAGFLPGHDAKLSSLFKRIAAGTATEEEKARALRPEVENHPKVKNSQYLSGWLEKAKAA